MIIAYKRMRPCTMLESQAAPDEAQIFSSQVRAARGLLGWSQSELARRAKISVAAIARIELGTTDCRMSTIQALKHSFMLSGIEFHKGPDGRFGVLQAPQPQDVAASAQANSAQAPQRALDGAVQPNMERSQITTMGQS
ncbi:MAG: XRE family transcriptional regulator [Alphaproteobacteria bacterium]|nr:XRE family transcriptional regulator [Alphaproteobacteria bacterium]